MYAPPERPQTRFEASLLPYAGGVALWLVILALRNPKLFSEPTVYGDELAWVCLQRGTSGAFVPRYFGTINLLPMLENWVYSNALRFHSMPAAWSLSSLLVSAGAVALVLHPRMAIFLPLFPDRLGLFAALALLPFLGLFPVATLPLQHLSFFFAAFVVLVSGLAPGRPPSRNGVRPLGEAAGFALLVFSAPMSTLLLPIPAAVLLRQRSKEDPRARVALSMLGVLAAHAVFQASHGGTALPGLSALPHVGALWARLYADRVAFEPFFGLSTKIVLYHADSYVAAYAVGLAISASALATIPTLPSPARFLAACALFTSVASVGFVLLGRYELTDGLVTWRHADYRLAIPEASLKFAHARYFVPGAMTLLVALSACFSPWATLARKPAWALLVLLYVVVLNHYEGIRYAEPVAPLLASGPGARTLRDLHRGEKAVTAAKTLALMDELDRKEAALPVGVRTRVPVEGASCDVELRRER